MDFLYGFSVTEVWDNKMCANTNDDNDSSTYRCCCCYYLRVKLQQLLKYRMYEMMYELNIYIYINIGNEGY